MLRLGSPLLSVSQTSSVWSIRRRRLVDTILNILGIIAVYLASELIIWGLSLALHPARLEFFASILGMVLVFFLSAAANAICNKFSRFYEGWVKSKVDLINANLGLGFSVPIVMLNKGDGPSSRDIARIIAVFAVTNLVSWTCVFFSSMILLSGGGPWTTKSIYLFPSPSPTPDPRPPTAPMDSEVDIPSKRRGRGGTLEDIAPIILPDSEQQTLAPSRSTSRERCTSSTPYQDRSAAWLFLQHNLAPILCFSGIFIIGIPLSAGLHDERALDAFCMCLIWTSSVRAQRCLKSSRLGGPSHADSWSVKAFVTMLNPVLLSILLMIAYTRLKALALVSHGGGLIYVLSSFSSGGPVYSLWSAAVSRPPPSPVAPGSPILPSIPPFGAGDAALSLLECGILTWGFKLFECRRHIFTPAGLATIALCSAAAAGNACLSVTLARAVGLRAPEALAFAARSTTLALARPATEALAGNPVVNAALVVSSGVLGQLIYPLVLDRLAPVGCAGNERQNVHAFSLSRGDTTSTTLTTNNNINSNNIIFQHNTTTSSRISTTNHVDNTLNQHSSSSSTRTDHGASPISQHSSSQTQPHYLHDPQEAQHKGHEEHGSHEQHRSHKEDKPHEQVKSHERHSSLGQDRSHEDHKAHDKHNEHDEHEDLKDDQDLKNPRLTIAAGIAIGVNGAAMGVSYLHEVRSRAAPYAALAMTVFGVTTVLATTVEPFRGWVIDMAGG